MLVSVVASVPLKIINCESLCNLTDYACKQNTTEEHVIHWSNCSETHPHPRTPSVTSLFFGCPGLFITLFLPCPALINHFNPLIFECPALFSLHFSVPRPLLSHPYFIWPRGCPGGWEPNNLTDALLNGSLNFREFWGVRLNLLLNFWTAH